MAKKQAYGGTYIISLNFLKETVADSVYVDHIMSLGALALWPPWIRH